MVSEKPLETWINHEREFRLYLDRFYKRSLRPSEYQLNTRNEPYVPPLGSERLQNKEACLRFIRVNTSIPVPDLIPGVLMNRLPAKDQAIVMQKVESHLRTTQYFPKDTKWQTIIAPRADLVFCHCDLSQSNIIVDPETLKIKGIIDWEYGGYWPAFFESPYFRDPRPSDAQFRNQQENHALIEFLGGEETRNRVTTLDLLQFP
ncbi:hypothetical protein GGR52DRAFT_581940 [Hypoxylon sp. FL1284]|nr:hypothetical protein GGR52DRAFT_581940 [Hypoxylon sp. FL1284]